MSCWVLRHFINVLKQGLWQILNNLGFPVNSANAVHEDISLFVENHRNCLHEWWAESFPSVIRSLRTDVNISWYQEELCQVYDLFKETL